MILCCGEALIDMIPTPTVSGGEGFVAHNGGAVFNTAIALGRLGVPVGQLSGVSSDVFGQQLERGLRASHVETRHLIVSDRPTTLAFVHLVDGHATYSFFDESSAGRMLTPGEMPDLSDDVTAVFMGGISLACEPCGEAYAELLFKSASTRAVMMDPNIRTGLIGDMHRYRERFDRMMAHCDIIKLSDEDLGWLDPSPIAIEDKAKALFDKGPSVVILTRVGAGDTFNAGVMARLSQLGRCERRLFQIYRQTS